jgi:hypothetical protein
MQRFFWLVLTIIFSTTLFLASCVNPRTLPGFRELSRMETERAQKYTEELIEKSPDFRDIDNLCTKEIPLFEGFSFVSKSAMLKTTSISYFYFSKADYRKVKPFYKDYFAQHGWQLVSEYDGGWGPKSVEVKNNEYRVILYNEGLGEDANYGFYCQKLSASNKVE